MENYQIDPTIAYDVVELPSKGIFYTNGRKSLRIAYLTAADENILISPNLLQSDTVIDELLKRKILDRDVNIDELVNEDRQAILIFLRNTAFGTEYVLEMIDPKTNEKFNFKMDLSVLKVKDFTLTPDSNGEYSYHMGVSKKNVTFKFLNNTQEKEIDKIRDGGSTTMVAPVTTKRLEMMIKSVEGIRDQMSIYQFIQNLPIKDSQDFRKFANENKPGIDLSVEVTAPSGEKVKGYIDFGVEFFRPFYGV
jgi:hypothetical protein